MDGLLRHAYNNLAVSASIHSSLAIAEIGGSWSSVERVIRGTREERVGSVASVERVVAARRAERREREEVGVVADQQVVSSLAAKPVVARGICAAGDAVAYEEVTDPAAASSRQPRR
jgi:hypothetical protein